MSTNTHTMTYTRTRISVVNDQFQLFFACAGMDDRQIEKMVKAVEEHKLEAVGVYIEEDGYRTADVSIEVDWDVHNQMCMDVGTYFDTGIAGWKDGKAPEAYISVQNLQRRAKEIGADVKSWIRVAADIRKDPEKHKALSSSLGYCYGSSVPPFKSKTIEKKRPIHYLEECTMISKEVE